MAINAVKECPFCHTMMRRGPEIKLKGMIVDMARDMIDAVLPPGSERWDCPGCGYFCYFKPVA